jgi:hypothetical protein
MDICMVDNHIGVRIDDIKKTEMIMKFLKFQKNTVLIQLFL